MRFAKRHLHLKADCMKANWLRALLRQFSASLLAAIASMLSDFWAQVAFASLLAVIAAIAYNRNPQLVPAAELAQIHYDAVN